MQLSHLEMLSSSLLRLTKSLSLGHYALEGQGCTGEDSDHVCEVCTYTPFLELVLSSPLQTTSPVTLSLPLELAFVPQWWPPRWMW